MRTFLSFFCVFIIVAIPTAMLSIAPSIETSVNQNNEDFQLAHLDIRFNGDHERLITKLNELIDSNEKNFSDYIYELRSTTSYQLYQNSTGTWYNTPIVALNSTRLPEINQIQISEGTFEMGENEALILKSYAAELGVGLGDNVTLYTPIGEESVTLVGMVKSIEFLSYELSLTGAIFIDVELYQYFHSIIDQMEYNSLVVFFEENPNLEDFNWLTEQMREELPPDYTLQLYYFWYVREFSTSAMFQDVISFTSQLLAIIAVVIIAIAGIVIFIITKRYAMEQLKQTGMLYAYGFSSRLILKTFLLRTFIISVLAIGIGLLASMGLLEFMCQMLATRWGVLELVTVLSPVVVLAIPLLVFFITQLFTYFACSSNVKISPYEAIRGHKRSHKRSKKKLNRNVSRKPNSFKRKLSNSIPFQLKYPLRNLSRNKRRGILTILAFIGTIMISFALLQTESSVDHTFESYFDNSILWDIKTQFNNFQTEESVENFGDNFTEILTIEPFLQLGGEPVSNPELSVQLRGLIPDSKLILIDLEEGQMFSNESAPEGIISSYIAKPLDLQVGDEFEFYALAQNFSITIVGICIDLDAHISLYMTLPAIEEILGYPLINGALIEIQTPIDSDILDNLILRINEENIVQYAILKSVYENRMAQMVDSQIIIIRVMVFVAMIISFITIFVIAFISVLERSREIALQRVFGFSKWQIITQILIELSLFVAIALLFGIFIGGNLLGQLISELISEFFFEVKIYQDFTNYLIVTTFSLGCILISTFPGINLLQKQNLAVSIDET